MRQMIEVADKSVSTEDFIHDDKEPLQKGILDVARLETVLAALVEHKVVSIRTENEKIGSNHSSPIALLASRIHRRFQSNSTVSSDREKGGKRKSSSEVFNHDGNKVIEEEGTGTQTIEGDGREDILRDGGHERSRRESRGDHSKRRGGRRGDRSERSGEERERHRDRDRDRSSDRNSDRCWIEREPCILQTSSEVLRHSDMLEECSVLSLGGEECVVVLERERTRTRTRRKRRKRKHHRTIIVESIDERVKVLDPDELPRRARWTIMVTACLLLFLCLLLVGVTLRMAPLIDDMVRQENERMMHESFNILTSNSSHLMMEHRKHLEGP